MFGIGLPELTVIIIVAVVVFGPDRLPEFARQAGRMVRQIRQFTQAARDDIRAELGPEFADFELSDLDPRKAVRKHILEAWEEDDEPAQKRPGQRPLQTGERPPYDADAT
ncbi:MAG: sec-independent translocase [Nocardioidaceae bacterium]